MNNVISIENIDLFSEYLKFNDLDFIYLFKTCSTLHEKFEDYNPELVLKPEKDFYSGKYYHLTLEVNIKSDELNSLESIMGIMEESFDRYENELYEKCNTFIYVNVL